MLTPTPINAPDTFELSEPSEVQQDIYTQIVLAMSPDSYQGTIISGDERENLLDNTNFFRCGQRAFINDLAWALSSQNGEYLLSKNETDWLLYNHEKHAATTFKRFAEKEEYTNAACLKVFNCMDYEPFKGTEARRLHEEIEFTRKALKDWGVNLSDEMLISLPLDRPITVTGAPLRLIAEDAKSLDSRREFKAMARVLDAFIANDYEEEVIKFLTDLSDKEIAKKIKSRMRHDYTYRVDEENQTVTVKWLDEEYQVVPEASQPSQPPPAGQPTPPATPLKPNKEELEQIARDFVEWYDGEDLSEVQSDTINIGEVTYIVTIQDSQAPQPQPISETSTSASTSTEEPTQLEDSTDPVVSPPLSTSDEEDTGTGSSDIDTVLSPYFKPSSDPIAMARKMARRESMEAVPSVTLFTADELYPPISLSKPKPPRIPTPDMPLEEMMAMLPTSTLERPLTSEFISSQGWKPGGVINGIEIQRKQGNKIEALRGIKKGLTLSPVQIFQGIANVEAHQGEVRSIKEIKMLYDKEMTNWIYGVITSDKMFSILEIAATKSSADEVIIEFQSYEFSIENVMSSFDVHIKQKKPKDKRQGKVEDNIAWWFKDLVDWELLGDDSKYKRFKQFIEQTTHQYQEGRWVYKKQTNGTWTLTLEWVAKPERTPDFVANYMNDIIQFAAKQEREREVK